MKTPVQTDPNGRAPVSSESDFLSICVKHSDGNIYSLLDMIVSAGPDGINPIEPVAGMDLKTVKKLVGDKVCICGNIKSIITGNL